MKAILFCMQEVRFQGEVMLVPFSITDSQSRKIQSSNVVTQVFPFVLPDYNQTTLH